MGVRARKAAGRSAVPHRPDRMRASFGRDARRRRLRSGAHARAARRVRSGVGARGPGRHPGRRQRCSTGSSASKHGRRVAAIARQALGDAATIVEGDARTHCENGSRVVLFFDVLHMMPAADQEAAAGVHGTGPRARRDDPDSRTGRRRRLALSAVACRQHREGRAHRQLAADVSFQDGVKNGRPASPVSASMSKCAAPARERPSPMCCSCSPGGRASLGEAADLDDLLSRAPIGVEFAAEPERAGDLPVLSGGPNDRLELVTRRAAPDPSRSGYPTTAPACGLSSSRQRHGKPEFVRAEEIANRGERSGAADRRAFRPDRPRQHFLVRRRPSRRSRRARAAPFDRRRAKKSGSPIWLRSRAPERLPPDRSLASV